MRRRIPRIIGRAMMAVQTGTAKSEFDHMGLADDGAELPTYRRHDWPVFLPRVGREAAARTSKARQAFRRVEVFNRDRYALERPDYCTRREGHVRRLGGLPSLLR